MLGFNKKKKIKIEPLDRGIYAFNMERAGDSIVFVQKLINCYEFIYLPGPGQFFLSFEDFEKSIKRGVLSLLEQLPQEIYDESLALSRPQKTEKIIPNEKTLLQTRSENRRNEPVRDVPVGSSKGCN